MRQFRLRVSVLELRGERLDDLLAESKLSNASVRHGHAAEIVGAVSCTVHTADEVAQLAQDLGYAVSGSDLLMLSGRSTAGVRVTRVDHPGEYPGRYY